VIKLSGWRTWAGIVVTVCGGIVLIGTGLLSDPMDPTKIWAGILAIAGAFGFTIQVNSTNKLHKQLTEVKRLIQK
jgi:drug/metabolite transporter (DMT)-like permease